jgi:hypothetical protein
VLLTLSAFAVKTAFEVPPPIFILDGTVALALLLVRLTGTPDEGAFTDRLTVHDAEPGPVNVEGVHVSPFRVAGAGRVMAPLAGMVASGEPSPAEARPESWTGILTSFGVCAI